MDTKTAIENYRKDINDFISGKVTHIINVKDSIYELKKLSDYSEHFPYDSLITVEELEWHFTGYIKGFISLGSFQEKQEILLDRFSKNFGK